MLDHPMVMPEPNSGCWLWMGQVDRSGYGRRSNGSYDFRPTHKVFWEDRNGPVPGGLCVLHRCDVRCCVNPDHMFLGTKTDNSIDKVIKGRQARGAAHSEATRRGFRVPYRRRILSEDEISTIRIGTLTAKETAALYGCSVKIVRLIRQGKR